MFQFKAVVLLLLIILIEKSNSLRKELVDGNSFHISCSGFNRIEIQSAKWIFQNGYGLDHYNAAQRGAYQKLNIDQTNSFKSLCDNNRKCEKQRQSSKIGLPSHLEFHVIYECYPGSCPHRAFVGKHIAPVGDTPKTFAEKAEKTRNQYRWQQTRFTSIFMDAANMTYLRDKQDKTKCEFIRAALKYDCTKTNNEWICDDKGMEKARHKTTSGHYFPGIESYRSSQLESVETPDLHVISYISTL